MDKLSRYNQMLLAAIGTLILTVLCIWILVGGGVLINEFFQSREDQRVFDNALTVEASADSEAQANLRDQQVTFETPLLIDTPNAIYVIAVSQVNLKSPELTSSSIELMDNYEYGLSEPISINSHSGVYNNIVIYEQGKESTTLVFNKKTHVGLFQNYMVDSTQYLLMAGTQTDSNQDNKLNDTDLQSFFLYNISTQELKEFTFDVMGLVDFYPLYNSNEVVLKFAQDKDQNGEVEHFREPVYLKRLTLSKYTITNLVDQETVNKIQSLVD